MPKVSGIRALALSILANHGYERSLQVIHQKFRDAKTPNEKDKWQVVHSIVKTDYKPA